MRLWATRGRAPVELGGACTFVVAMASVIVAAGGASPVSRPSYNTGTGFFVLDGKLYDANGYEFRFRGLDRCHYDSDSSAGMARAGPNAVRLFVDTNYGANWSYLANIVETQHIRNHQVPIVTVPSTTAGKATSCSQDPGVLADVVEKSWLPSVDSWKPLEKYAILNLANEWGPSNSTVWKDSYISAVQKMRAAGYLAALMIDAGGCGQDIDDLIHHAAQVFHSDPHKNIVFALHPYGSVNDFSGTVVNITPGKLHTVVTLQSMSVCHPFAHKYCPALNMTNTYSGIHAYNVSGVKGMPLMNGAHSAPQNVGGVPGAWTVTLNVDSSEWPHYRGGGVIVDYNGNPDIRIGRLAALRESSGGAAFAVTEFGPGRNIGPSPTIVTPLQIISAAEAHGLGWLAWAWDDNDAAQSDTNNEWFGMTYHSGHYSGNSSELTMFGQQIVEGCVNAHPGGCGCPDGLPLPPYVNRDDPQSTPPKIYGKIDPGCVGKRSPK